MTLRILHYSDIENAYDDPDRIGRLAGCINANRDQRTLVVGTGDNTAPGVLSLVTEGEAGAVLFRRYLARFRYVRQPRLRLRNRPYPRTRSAVPTDVAHRQRPRR